MKTISAEIIADSISTNGKRCTTLIVVFPRIVLAEFNTHRALSKNSASSRAIPFNKMLAMVQSDPFIPVKWIKEHKGMQGYEYFDDREEIVANGVEWLKARNSAVEAAISLSDMGVTKQFCNRLLEPFMWHTVIVTGTDFQNFFALRAHEAAEIHIQRLAYKMLDAYNNSTPQKLKNGEWHIPFGSGFDDTRLSELAMKHIADTGSNETIEEVIELLKVKISTARCARVSYLNFEGKDDYNADVRLHDSLSLMGHWSPFEHCAKATGDSYYYGNFQGFKQYRKSFIDEDKKDSRVHKNEI